MEWHTALLVLREKYPKALPSICHMHHDHVHQLTILFFMIIFIPPLSAAHLGLWQEVSSAGTSLDNFEYDWSTIYSEMSHPSHPFPTAVAAALGSGALSRLSWDPQALLQETPKCCRWHTHTTPHTGSRLASCAELFFLQANENIKTWKVPPNLGAGNTLRVGLRNPCLDHLRGCLFIHWLLRFNV